MRRRNMQTRLKKGGGEGKLQPAGLITDSEDNNDDDNDNHSSILVFIQPTSTANTSNRALSNSSTEL